MTSAVFQDKPISTLETISMFAILNFCCRDIRLYTNMELAEAVFLNAQFINCKLVLRCCLEFLCLRVPR